jgi:hypothetical protein
MPARDAEALAGLVAEVGRFYVRDRAMRRAQAEMSAALAAGGPPSDALVERYLAAVRRYFGGFEREARAHLADLDRRLARANQLQFNLTAERGVTQRRVEITQGVLGRIEEVAAG